MRIRSMLLLTVLLSTAPAALWAQENVTTAPAADNAMVSVQQKLMPDAAARLLAPVTEAAVIIENETAQPLMQRRGRGTGLMLAGAALFVAGLIIENDAGTLLAVTGAAIGAYGLYIYFQ